MSGAQWERRIRRASQLASMYPFAAEGLQFYTRVATFQKGLQEEIQKAMANSTKISSGRPLRDEFDLFLLLPKFPAFLSLIREASPARLAHAGAALAEKGPAGWQQALEDFWWKEDVVASALGEAEEARTGDSFEAASERLLAWIFLQPYAEYLASNREPANFDGTPSTCPLCGGKPIAGVLRSEGDGAKKSLVCMLCAHEWIFRRIYCPACGEEREPQMAFYSAPEIAHVRVDVCDTCHTYLKSVDLTKTGLAVPIVDELATIPLDLWAREHGYEKLQINLLGI
jgi:formate dehydrogenase accessory protein FdhE